MQKGWGPGYQYNCIHSGTIATSGDLSTVWYNYASASAGTIFDVNTTTSNPATNTNRATETICPKGWTLPTVAQERTIFGSDYLNSFSPVLGGYYDSGNGKLNESIYGIWWTNEAQGGPRRNQLEYSQNNGILQRGNLGRAASAYIRCVQKS